MRTTKNNTTRFSSASDIKNYLQMCIERQEVIGDELKEISIKKFNFRNAAERSYKKALKQQLKRLKVYIQNYSDLLENYTTFSTDEMEKFLVNYISMKEGESYDVLTEVVGDEVLIPIFIDETPYFHDYYQGYDIITTKSNKEKIEKMGCSYIEDVLKICDDQKYIVIEQRKQTALFTEGALNESFQQYPYLEEVADQFVDYRLSEPSISDSECFHRIMLNKRKSKELKFMEKAYQGN